MSVYIGIFEHSNFYRFTIIDREYIGLQPQTKQKCIFVIKLTETIQLNNIILITVNTNNTNNFDSL